MRLGADGLLRGVRHVLSPNSDLRPDKERITLVVIHSISLPPGHFGGSAVERLFLNRLDPAEHPFYAELTGLRVSAHFLVRRAGGVIQFVPVGRRAWHAGESVWRGRSRCNDFSIGIELEGTDRGRFTEAQYRALARILAAVRQRHPVSDVAGHSDVAPGRKSDPGSRFDWKRLRRDCGPS